MDEFSWKSYAAPSICIEYIKEEGPGGSVS
jgi:hypothetical protein